MSDVTEGSGTIFADLNSENPEDYLLKSRLASMIYDSIQAKGWTQQRSAEILGITQPAVSNICRGLLDHFSAEKLLGFLAKLERRVTITVHRKNMSTEEIVVNPGAA